MTEPSPPLLRPEQRQKLDETRDAFFYGVPRFVFHVDDGFLQHLTQIYRTQLKPQSRILDLMSSWVSHLPDEMHFEHVEGHGLNLEELAKNPRLDHYFVQDLNEDPQLPLESGSFDAVLNAVSIQYLQQPEQVFAEVARILKPGGLFIISFSNRMFYQKAIQVWRDGSERERVQLVKRYFEATPGFEMPHLHSVPGQVIPFLQMLGLGGTDPFYALVGRKQDSPSIDE
ncbi:MAG: class I SAM-dependent methyltransferase [Prochlorotrichaceae cyanobacterium]